MKITIKQGNKDLIDFGPLFIGTCFIPSYVDDNFERNIWLKTRSVADFNAVNIATGGFQHFADDNKVELVDAELLINRI